MPDLAIPALTPMPRPLSLGALAACALVALAACAGPPAAPTRASLEARVAADPSDVEALRDLGALLALDGNYGPALGALERARQIEPDHGQTLYLIGLSNEALNRPGDAETAYRGYLRVDGPYRDSLRGRLDALQRERLRREFALAMAGEDTLGAVAGDAVGVLPFAYRGADEEYAPLGRGLAEVLSVDLAAMDGLTVVERARLQALLAEFDLARQGRLDPATAPQAGRLLRADRLIGGEYDVQAEALRIDAAVWEGRLLDVETTEGGVADLFRVQKTVTLNVLSALGIAVSEADEARILTAPTRDLLAFLLYSRGLLEEDDGDFVRAGELYAEALTRDPTFSLAAQRAEAVTLSAASAKPAPQVLAAAAADAAPSGEAFDAVRLRSAALRGTLGDHVVPGTETREPAAEGSRGGILGPLPDPPPPPTSGGDRP